MNVSTHLIMNKYTRKVIQEYVDNNVEARDILDESEWNHIRENRQENIVRNFFFEPSHDRQRKTYRIQLVISPDFSLFKFIGDVTEFLNGSYDIDIDLGYFALKTFDNDSLRFIFPAKCNSFIKATVKDETDYDQMMEQVKKVDGDLLLQAFLSHQKEYAESGFVPRSAVCLETYITTF